MTATVVGDATLTFSIPEIVEEGYQKLVKDLLERTLDGVMKILVFGPHSSDIEHMLKKDDQDKDNPPNPFGG